jgi:hypothetical protein
MNCKMDRLVRRRDRTRRNHRIAAGVVGIAVFVPAVWVVTSGLSLDRSEKSVALAGEVTGPAETAPAETAPAGLASAASDVVRQEQCSGDAISRLELTLAGRNIPWLVGIRVRYEVHRSPVGHVWRIAIRSLAQTSFGPPFARGIRVADDSGYLAVQRHVMGKGFAQNLFRATALDTQTGQVCTVDAPIDI